MNGDLATLGLGHKQVRQAITINISPQDTTPRFIGFVQWQNLKLTLLERAGKNFGGFASEFGYLGSAGILGNGDDLSFAILFQIIRPVGSDGR